MAQRPNTTRVSRTKTTSQGRVLSPAEWEAQKRAREFNQVIPPKTKHESASGLILRPKNVSFTTQNLDEQVFMLLRQHWSTNIGWVFNAVVYAVAPFLITFIANLFNIRVIDTLGWRITIIVVLMYYSVLLTNIIRNLSDWYFNLYLVTNERVIDYDYHPFTSSGVSESGLATVQDVKQSSVGFLPSIFNYGDVSIFTAADRNVIVFHKVPNPTLVRDKISDLAAIAVKNSRG